MLIPPGFSWILEVSSDPAGLTTGLSFWTLDGWTTPTDSFQPGRWAAIHTVFAEVNPKSEMGLSENVGLIFPMK